MVQLISSDSVSARTDFGGSAEIGYLRDRIPPGTGPRGTGFASQTPRIYGESTIRVRVWLDTGVPKDYNGLLQRVREQVNN